MKTSTLMDSDTCLPVGNNSEKSIAGRLGNQNDLLESFMLFHSFATATFTLNGQKIHPSELAGLMSTKDGLLLGTIRQGTARILSVHGVTKLSLADIFVLPLSSGSYLSGHDCLIDCLLFDESYMAEIPVAASATSVAALSAWDVSANLFYQQFTSFRAYLKLMQQEEAEELVRPLLMTLNAILLRRQEHRGPAPSKPLQRLQTFISTHLLDADLDPNMIAKHLGLSRASLYRLAEPLGGIQKYIREQRLKRAYKSLSTQGAKSLSITNLAFDLGFNTEAAFRRSFKESFGQTPTEVRKQAG